MKKRFVLWMVLCMLFTMSMGIVVPAVADGVPEKSVEGDTYYFEPVGWPNKHWVYMTQEEIDAYQSTGWEMYTGVLWIGPNDEVAEFQEVKTAEIQERYNNGYKFVVFYHWRCDGTMLGKNQEQSVDVGVWKLSPAQAIEYHKTYIKPEITVDSDKVTLSYLSQWYSSGVACSDPNGLESEEELAKLEFVRHCFDTYNFGYGSTLYLARGDYEKYSYSDALQVNNSIGFQDEMPVWGALPR